MTINCNFRIELTPCLAWNDCCRNPETPLQHYLIMPQNLLVPIQIQLLFAEIVKCSHMQLIRIMNYCYNLPYFNFVFVIVADFCTKKLHIEIFVFHTLNIRCFCIRYHQNLNKYHRSQESINGLHWFLLTRYDILYDRYCNIWLVY